MNRGVLVIELVILCGPALAILSFGLLYSPIFVLGSLAGKAPWQVGAILIICGTWGFISLANLALHVLRRRNWPGRLVQWFGLICGIAAAVIAISLMEKANIEILIFLGPIIALAHLLYLTKNFSQPS